MFRQISHKIVARSKGSQYSSSEDVVAAGKEVPISSKIIALLVLPYKIDQPMYKLDEVIVPASTGQMNHTTKYFINSGFAFIHAHSFVDIVTPEAVLLNLIDPDKVQKGPAKFTQKLSSASTELEKAEAQIGVAVHTCLNTALQAS
ncbi:hypothetical protein MKW98_030009 [Papaver atlanticum]|uniref:Uncharacterized protein n=1 Tax=Papaver atlanticum TaxID=357466 RepID=A0AAD4T7L9_9MAGN|nr:hypothetical protein MKW98_030009 [Papaver atlanticum]